MTRRSRVVAMALVVDAACRGTETTTSPAEPTPAEGRAQKIRIELPLEPDMPDVPRLVAREALQSMGYIVEAAAYSDNVIAIQAMLAGELDVARIPMPQALAAIQQGAAIAAIMSGGRLSRLLVAAPDIKKCSDLNHKRVSISALVAPPTLALRRYIATRCPGTNVEMVVIAGVENRLAALLSGRTGGAILEAANLLALQRVQGSRFNVLSDLGVDFPALSGSAFVAPRAFLEKYPTTARDIVRELILATRRVEEHAALSRAIERYLGLDSGEAQSAATSYLARKPWDLNGGLSGAVLQANIDFYVESGVIKPGMTPALVADRSYLTAVLDEIGRK
jgi:ABC-type nitrate/sulfonate/bicarbonate transport system substrate-binding protein